MGRRKGRRRPTREEKIRRSEGRKPDEGRGMTDDKPERRREVSPETREIVAEYARVMGWTPERVLPHVVGAEG